MREVNHMNTNETGFTGAVELWWIVFQPHEDCPPACRGATQWKFVLVAVDRERFARVTLDQWNNVTFLHLLEDMLEFRRLACRPAILEMPDGVFRVWTSEAGACSVQCRVSPFLSGQEFWDWLMLELGEEFRDFVLMLGDVELSLTMSLLTQGIHAGFNEDVGRLWVRLKSDY